MKKIITIALIAAMMLTMLVANVSADAWDGTSVSESLKGEGTVASPYLVESASDLAFLAKSVNEGTTYEGKYITQTADIDLGGKEFAPIGNRDVTKPFCGLYDGNGKKITNFYQTFSYRFGGLFGFMTTIKDWTPGIINLTLEGKMDGGNRNGDTYAAGLVGWTQQNSTSGVKDANRILIANCVVDVDYNLATDIHDKDIYSGGISARAGFVHIVNCVNKGDITVKGDKSCLRAGAIAGWIQDAIVENTMNFGKVTAINTTDAKDCYVAGLFGLFTTSTDLQVRNCVNYGEVFVKGGKVVQTAGIVGRVYAGKATITNCANLGNITAESTNPGKFNEEKNKWEFQLPYAGGILGYASCDKTAIITCYNSGEVKTVALENVTGHNPGGIAGVLNNAASTTYAKDCLTTTSRFKGWFNDANTAEGCQANVDAYTVALAIYEIEKAAFATAKVTVNGTDYNFVGKAIAEPTAPVAPAPTPDTGDVTSVIVLALVAVSCGAVLTLKKTR